MSKSIGNLTKERILEINITSDSRDKIIQYISECIKNDQKSMIVTPNPEMFVIAHQDESFKDIINNADIAIPDGGGVILASKLLQKKIQRKITGTDLMIDLCNIASKEDWTVFLLGGRGSVSSKVQNVLKKSYPKIKIIGILEGSPDEDQDRKVIEEVKILTNGKHIDLLFVAYGAPKQEKWIARNMDKLSVNVVMGVGGAFNYISKQVPRAPKFVRNIGFEWLYRLIIQPWRWKRQLRLIQFIILVLRNKFSF